MTEAEAEQVEERALRRKSAKVDHTKEKGVDQG